VTAGLKFAVGQPPGPGLGVRDSDSGHTLKCPPGGPVLPGPGPRLSGHRCPRPRPGGSAAGTRAWRPLPAGIRAGDTGAARWAWPQARPEPARHAGRGGHDGRHAVAGCWSADRNGDHCQMWPVCLPPEELASLPAEVGWGVGKGG
jgi:hypothetical protein